MSRKLSTNEFIAKARNVHDYRYSYEDTEYVNNATPLDIICYKHGTFTQTPRTHLSGSGCRECGIEHRAYLQNRKAQNSFIQKIKKVHGNRYDYSLTNYVDSTTPVTIGCKLHGTYEQTPSVHLAGHGCSMCSSEKNSNAYKISQEEFINRSRLAHGNAYDYSLTEYENGHDEVIIICKVHGKFKQAPRNHLRGRGCSKCGHAGRLKNKRILEEDKFFEVAKRMHGDLYDYSKVKYKSGKIDVTIVCPIHGEFSQSPYKHVIGQKCQKCSFENKSNPQKSNTAEFIKRSKKVHKSLYDYSEVDYKNNNTKVDIICKKHGMFSQLPTSHLKGHGCLECGLNNITANKIIDKIKNLRLHSYFKKECSPEFIGLKKYDLAMILNNGVPIAFEYDGEFHSKPHWTLRNSSVMEKKASLKRVQQRDRDKDRESLENGIHLIRLNYNEYQDNPVESVQHVLDEIVALSEGIEAWEEWMEDFYM